MSVQDLALQRSKYKHLSDEEWRWFLQQVEGRERTADKLPTFAAIDDWWYPVRLSCEQCSSELTARYKVQILQEKPVLLQGGLTARQSYSPENGPLSMVDLTAGFGVDTYFLSELFAHTDYVEQNAELCRIAEHNFKQPTPSLPKGKDICIHNTTAEEFLASLPFKEGAGLDSFDLIFLDPARRDSHGGKVFKLADCTPNVVELLPELLKHGKRILLKLSPMLDISQATKELSAANWDVYIVAIKNEVKEVLLLSGGNGTVTAIDLDKKDQAFVFTKEEEKDAQIRKCENEEIGKYLYEPSAAILKAGAYKLVAERFGLHKLDVNTHLYASDTLIENFPGRIFKALPFREGMGVGSQANVLCRNYPLTPEQLKKKYRLKDGGDNYLIGCRVNGKPMLFEAERI